MICRSSLRLMPAAFTLSALLVGCTGQIEGTNGPGEPGGDTTSPGSAPGPGRPNANVPGVPAGVGPFAAGGPAAPGTSGVGAPGAFAELGAFDRGVRRLSARELEADADAWFPEFTAARKRLVNDSSGLFDNSAADLDTSTEWIDGLLVFAAELASLGAKNDAVRERVRVCKEETATCLREIVKTWGRRLLRRPLADDELSKLLASLEGSPDLKTVEERAFAAVEVLLHHPEHVFRIEIPGPGGLPTDYAIASRMSFALWGRGPDDQLLDEAGAGSLANATRRAPIARRMLASEAARRQVLEHHAQWMGFDVLPKAEIGGAMWDETRRLLERVVFDDPRSDYHVVFLSDETFLTPALARHYGLSAPAGGAGWVRSSDPKRRGILGHGTFLSTHANPDDTSPVKRGKAILENLLCSAPLVPPPNADVDVKPKAGECRLDFFAKVHAVGSCAACHKLLDGVGSGLERFDRFGAARDFEPGKPTCRLDGKGQLAGTPFEGAAGLGALLVKHESFDRCAVRQTLRFAVGHDIGAAPNGFFERALAAFGRTNRSVRELLVAAVADPAFVVPARR